MSIFSCLRSRNKFQELWSSHHDHVQERVAERSLVFPASPIVEELGEAPPVMVEVVQVFRLLPQQRIQDRVAEHVVVQVIPLEVLKVLTKHRSVVALVPQIGEKTVKVGANHSSRSFEGNATRIFKRMLKPMMEAPVPQTGDEVVEVEQGTFFWKLSL